MVFEYQVPLIKVVYSSTVTSQVADNLELIFAVMVAVPAATPVTTPLDETVAIDVALELHKIGSDDEEGIRVAIIVLVAPTSIESVVGLRVMPVALVTVTLHVAVTPEAAFAVTVAEPAATPVTTPLDETVAIEVELELHMIVLFALEGDWETEIVLVSPTAIERVVGLRLIDLAAME
jgi:hypothetical protein